MSVLKSGGLLLLLSIPMALYAAWQVNGVVRTDLVISDPPADRGPPREQLAAAHTKISNWAGEVRKAAGVFLQYRAAGPEDASPDADAAAVVKASAVRAADLNDLDLFLSDLERPNFSGKLKTLYVQWMDERKELKRDAEAVTNWLTRLPALQSATDAKNAMNVAMQLINTYGNRSRFSDKAKAAAWRVQGRLAIIKALNDLGDAQYQAAVRVKLPLEPGNNAVKTAAETQRELKVLLTALNNDLRLADEEKAPLDASSRAEAERKGALADECAARQELLTLFAREDLFTNPTGAPAWLKQVAAQYRRTKDDKVRALIREKVQEFCDAFIPGTVRLDDKVLLKNREVPRKEVVLKYDTTMGTTVVTKREPLLAAVDGVNEFNLEVKHPGANTFAMFDGSEEYPRDLKPTALSKAAVLFDGERKKLADSTTGPKWSAKSVGELKKKCEAQKDLVDQLQTSDAASGAHPPKIWTRLSGLAAALADCADLFDTGP
jgi:hypothetical protein